MDVRKASFLGVSPSSLDVRPNVEHTGGTGAANTGTTILHHHHHPWTFVALSLGVAIFGSWTALDLARRVSGHVGQARLVWISTAAVAMGLSIWSMHFIAMLSFDPGSPVAYDPSLTVASLALAISSTWAAFLGATRERVGRNGLLIAGAAMGAGICLMHYVGMAALRSAVSLGYRADLVVASLILAVVASTAALAVARRGSGPIERSIAASLLGAAVVGMHFTAMAALRLTPSAEAHPVAPLGVSPFIIGMGVAGGTLLILFLALMASLYDQRGNILQALDAGGVGYWEFDLGANVLHVSSKGKALFGLGPDEALTLDRWLGALSPEDRARRDKAFESALRTGGAYDIEYRLINQDRWVNVRGEVLRDASGKARRMMGVVLDVTDRHVAFAAVTASERRLRLLTNELNHRVKNTLATIQSIAAHTARRAGSMSDFRKVFEDRLMALSATHDVLTQSSWEAAAIGDLLAQELAPYPDSQVSLEGDRLELSARQALALGLVFHELATNAAKYGALSVASGCVKVAWRAVVADDGVARFVLDWREEGGPIVAPPKGLGFGSRLIKISIEQDLGGVVDVRYAPEGLTCVIQAPLPVAAVEPVESFFG
ncbi:MHYT domain-containing protein [Caulobacter sp. 1776]|uniref:MHYT domain-containing protein n=1 Tax=Caulobacter sp. 1776 TaxID=3156420 RepID=UPI003395306E